MLERSSRLVSRVERAFLAHRARCPPQELGAFHFVWQSANRGDGGVGKKRRKRSALPQTVECIEGERGGGGIMIFCAVGWAAAKAQDVRCQALVVKDSS